MRLPPIRVQKVLAGIGLAVGFLMMTSVFVPDFSRAADEDTPYPEDDPAAGLPHLGSIEDLEYRIEIFGGAEEPLYSLFDAATGEAIGALLTADEVADFFPRIDLPGLEFGIDGAIMRADPETPPF